MLSSVGAFSRFNPPDMGEIVTFELGVYILLKPTITQFQLDRRSPPIVSPQLPSHVCIASLMASRCTFQRRYYA
jgi:hypothetical protein